MAVVFEVDILGGMRHRDDVKKHAGRISQLAGICYKDEEERASISYMTYRPGLYNYAK